MDTDQIVNDIMNAQAELQRGLGVFRLQCSDPLEDMDRWNAYIEERLADCLYKLHDLLGELGHPMPPR